MVNKLLLMGEALQTTLLPRVASAGRNVFVANDILIPYIVLSSGNGGAIVSPFFEVVS